MECQVGVEQFYSHSSLYLYRAIPDKLMREWKALFLVGKPLYDEVVRSVATVDRDLVGHGTDKYLDILDSGLINAL